MSSDNIIKRKRLVNIMFLFNNNFGNFFTFFCNMNVKISDDTSLFYCEPPHKIKIADNNATDLNSHVP